MNTVRTSTRTSDAILWLVVCLVLIAGLSLWYKTLLAPIEPPPLRFKSITKYTIDGRTFWDLTLLDGTRCFATPDGALDCDWDPSRRQTTPTAKPSTL